MVTAKILRRNLLGSVHYIEIKAVHIVLERCLVWGHPLLIWHISYNLAVLGGRCNLNLVGYLGILLRHNSVGMSVRIMLVIDVRDPLSEHLSLFHVDGDKLERRE